jgi:predicted nucleotide-binding protein (sugar kinase/HSP70/actin superfamily)
MRVHSDVPRNELEDYISPNTAHDYSSDIEEFEYYNYYEHDLDNLEDLDEH